MKKMKTTATTGDSEKSNRSRGGSRLTTRTPRPGKRRQTFLPLAIGMSGGVVLAGLAFWFFKEQAENVVQGHADKYDEMVLDLVHQVDSPEVTKAMEIVTALGSHAAISTAAGATAVMMFAKRRPHDAWTVIISTGGAMIVNSLLKYIFQRRRPVELVRRIRLPRSHSFPSGHSLLSAVTYPIVVHHLVETHSSGMQVAAHLATGVVVLSVGLSRIYFGVHFPSDVLGGYAAGLGWLGLISLGHTAVDRDRLIARARKELPS